MVEEKGFWGKTTVDLSVDAQWRVRAETFRGQRNKTEWKNRSALTHSLSGRRLSFCGQDMQVSHSAKRRGLGTMTVGKYSRGCTYNTHYTPLSLFIFLSGCMLLRGGQLERGGRNRRNVVDHPCGSLQLPGGCANLFRKLAWKSGLCCSLCGMTWYAS